MNILILTSHLNVGGITRYVLTLSYGLKRQGHKVIVGSGPGWGEEFLKQNDIAFLKLPLKTKSVFSPRLIRPYFILNRIINKEGIDIIHAQTRITQFLGFLLSRRLNIACISTFHGFYRPHLIRKLIPCLGDLSIAVSQAVGRHLTRDFNLDKKNLRVIYNSVSPELDYPREEDYSYLKGSPTLGIIARLSQEKGHLELFSAFRQLIKEYPQARLLVVGSGKKEKELKSWVSRQGLSAQIIFLGNIPALKGLFKIIDVSILPSSLEGLGLSILEAQANGVPVVASCVGGITEIIRDRETGILVKPGDSHGLYRGIRLLLEDNLLRSKIIDKAKQQIKQGFSLEGMARQVQSVYRQAAEKRKSK
jgi:glycosyltransferase involved in cell wall biosynthesis